MPLNAVLALVRADGAWFSDLADQGFRLHSIELKIQSPLGLVVADVVIYREAPDLVLLCECKSGRNLEEAQARKYAASDAAALRRGGSLPGALAGREQSVTVRPMFVVMDEARANVESALQRWDIEAPVLSIDHGFARVDGPCPSGLEPFVSESGSPRRLPFGRVRVDHQSPLSELLELLAPQIIAAQAKRQSELDLEQAAASIYRAWPSLSVPGRRELVRRLRDCAKHLASNSMKGIIRVEHGSNAIAPRVVIEQTPATLDTRGMPQAWQGEARGMAEDLGRSGGPPPEEDQQLSLDDLDLGDAEERDAQS